MQAQVCGTDNYRQQDSFCNWVLPGKLTLLSTAIGRKQQSHVTIPELKQRELVTMIFATNSIKLNLSGRTHSNQHIYSKA